MSQMWFQNNAAVYPNIILKPHHWMDCILHGNRYIYS